MSPTASKHAKGFISIRWTIPLFMIAPLVTGVGLTGWLAFRSGQKAINELGDALSSRMSALIEQRVENYLSKPRIVQEGIAAAIRSDNLNPDDVEGMRQYFLSVVQTPDLVSPIYWGNPQGNFIRLERTSDQIIAKIRTTATAPNRAVYRLDGQGNRVETLQPERFDPRERPWYKTVMQNDRASWSPVYIGASSGQLELTWATPVETNDSRLIGILGSDLSLAQISEFLQGLKNSSSGTTFSGEAFIVERSGHLIATSTHDELFQVEGNEKRRLLATEARDPLVQSTAEHLTNEFVSFAQLMPSVSEDFKRDNDRILVRTYSLKDAIGIDWLLVVAIPEKDFMGTIHQNMRITLFVGAGITVFATVMGLAIALWITRPIGQLSHAAKNIQSDSFEPNSLAGLIARPDEFGELAKLFHDMASVIISREQSLEEQVQALRSEINESSNLSQSELNDLKTLVRRSRQTRSKL